ncbi:polysaccharide biosynthesis protein [Bacillus sp. B15-48]|uniref:putative polysaccharide biosynthesis protein n=1 Tax=Bacillus sp. B15-48 TaxID=1548601 RepID=UPI00193EF8E9|nr:polysaccharide biosynthesis protein [Bacillus sp. B15-48]MBM4765307.1 oligosaccharide flippase family protein [Bacillus sp. B15-48]
MKPDRESQLLFRGAFILTCAAIVTKILSAIYRVPFQNIVGDVGFYIYQQVYPFYGMMLILATQGFPVVISKLYKEQLSQGNEQKGAKVLAISFFFLLFFSCSLFLFFYFGADWIASIMGDEQLSSLFRVVAIPFLILPFTASLRGYFQGRGNMIPTAISQVGEQLVRVITIILLSYVLLEAGYSLYTAGSGAVFGAVTGGLVGLSTLTFFFLRKADVRFAKEDRGLNLFRGAGPVLKLLIIQGFAISISSMVLILMQLADALNLYNLLIATGIEENVAKISKGVFDRGQPLIQLGTVVATSMALSIVPAISGRKQKEEIIIDVRIALQVSLIVGAAAAVGLFSIIEPTNRMLFENNEGSAVLAILSIAIFPVSMLITISGVFQGMDNPIYPAYMIAASFALKYGLNVLLVPLYGTKGAAIATLIALSIVLLLMIRKLRQTMQQQVLSLLFIGKVLIVSGIMGVFLHFYLAVTDYAINLWLPGRLGASMQALSAVALGAILYLVTVIKLKLLREYELLMLPFGSKLLFLLPQKTGDDR